MRQPNGAHHCKKCGKNFASAASLRYHWAKAIPCDSPQSAEQKKKITIKKKNKTPKQALKCPKCQATFSCSQNLRLHLSRLNPCDNSEPKQHDPGNKTCPKCSTTFNSAQSLRLHLTRLIPCDAEQLTGTELDKLKCHKKFASERSLNIHLSQRECDGSHSSSQSHRMKKATKTLDLSRPDKTPSAKASLDEYLQMTSHNKESEPPVQSKQGGHHIKEAPLAIRAPSTDQPKRQHEDHLGDIVAMHHGNSKRKRNAEEGREDISPLGEANKRVRSEPRSFADLAARVSKTPSTPTGASGGQNSKHAKHGGNILTDGCCCRDCVRKWARTMVNRLSRMSDEVTSLRELVKMRGDSTSHKSEVAEAKATTSTDACTLDYVGSVSSPKVKKQSAADTKTQYSAKDSFTPASLDCSGQDIVSKTKVKPLLSGATSNATNTSCSTLSKDPVKLSLTEKYNHLNDQIITNERALEDSAAYLKEISGHDTNTSELRTQLDELRIYIDVEKGKRDEIVAAIIAQRWVAKRNEFRLLLENMAVKSKPNAERAFHEECAEIASQVEEKNKVLAKLGGLIGAAGLSAGMLSSMKSGVGIPKYAVEKTAKSFLERQRDDVFMCLLRSSPRIYLQTKEKLMESKR
ncbi:hypothetical protein PF005_g134 [Phytophthora fragariae]|uniref:C2H2-type domain-containing protein n=1 Tax=Phytophthora fragariae TaxID=53985 RepID=A0A6A3Q8K4_9STRA|nr:hypothetical protein PF009_g133 [Phytophthora fragariae]KAE9031492.1 hypothetical protein PF011_g124 [Phytophthora fragariae]KAE9071318.1 hypothetical protein PF006_g29180 [Phytophthora fragariae]KAE9140837.1 hypothetical protein PF010_g1 [Phytophthora fragariae]KAE9141721.1 hypothetical protein PF007_g69 [Phytophthora fragariae]